MVAGNDNTPFFILGCVRSGTTMLRDLLRMHPRLEGPEETHFYRWADPFGSPRYDRQYVTARLFSQHRQLDGIGEKEFHEARRKAENRREMSDAYGRLYLEACGNPAGRWFDKTPQNVYGLPLIIHDYPEARFIHIFRNPLNVVASLVEGKVMARHSVKGAVNYWLESMVLIDNCRRQYPERFLDIPYEEFVLAPDSGLRNIFAFINEDPDDYDFSGVATHPEKNKYKKVLSDEEVAYVLAATESWRNKG